MRRRLKPLQLPLALLNVRAQIVQLLVAAATQCTCPAKLLHTGGGALLQHAPTRRFGCSPAPRCLSRPQRARSSATEKAFLHVSARHCERLVSSALLGLHEAERAATPEVSGGWTACRVHVTPPSRRMVSAAAAPLTGPFRVMLRTATKADTASAAMERLRHSARSPSFACCNAASCWCARSRWP